MRCKTFLNLNNKQTQILQNKKSCSTKYTKHSQSSISSNIRIRLLNAHTSPNPFFLKTYKSRIEYKYFLQSFNTIYDSNIWKRNIVKRFSLPTRQLSTIKKFDTNKNSKQFDQKPNFNYTIYVLLKWKVVGEVNCLFVEKSNKGASLNLLRTSFNDICDLTFNTILIASEHRIIGFNKKIFRPFYLTSCYFSPHDEVTNLQTIITRQYPQRDDKNSNKLVTVNNCNLVLSNFKHFLKSPYLFGGFLLCALYTIKILKNHFKKKKWFSLNADLKKLNKSVLNLVRGNVKHHRLEIRLLIKQLLTTLNSVSTTEITRVSLYYYMYQTIIYFSRRRLKTYFKNHWFLTNTKTIIFKNFYLKFFKIFNQTTPKSEPMAKFLTPKLKLIKPSTNDNKNPELVEQLKRLTKVIQKPRLETDKIWEAQTCGYETSYVPYCLTTYFGYRLNYTQNRNEVRQNLKKTQKLELKNKTLLKLYSTTLFYLTVFQSVLVRKALITSSYNYSQHKPITKPTYKRLFKLLFNFKGHYLYITLLNKQKKILFSLNTGLFIKFFNFRKSLKKSKSSKLLLMRYLRKLLIITKINNFKFYIKQTSSQLPTLLHMLHSPLNHVFTDPLTGEAIDEENKEWKLPVFNFVYIIFLKNKPYGKMKTKNAGRLKRKIQRRLIKLNNIKD